MTYTYFKEDYRRQGPAVPGSRPYEQQKNFSLESNAITA